MPDLNKTLVQRGKTHGDFDKMAEFIQGVKYLIRMHTTDEMTASQLEALDSMALKMGRIVTGDPTHDDHWDDISGYAQLGKGVRTNGTTATEGETTNAQ